MLIRLGYEIEIECAQATPLISLLEIHPERQPDIKRQSIVATSPRARSSVYRDLFGNTCRRFMAPQGSFKFTYDATVQDDGAPDRVKSAGQHRPCPGAA